MLLTEYNEAEQMELFRQEGFEEGFLEVLREQGENRLATLCSKLFSLGRSTDARRAARDTAYRKQLYEEFQIA